MVAASPENKATMKKQSYSEKAKALMQQLAINQVWRVGDLWYTSLELAHRAHPAAEPVHYQKA